MKRSRLEIWYTTHSLYHEAIHSFQKVNIHRSSARKVKHPYQAMCKDGYYHDIKSSTAHNGITSWSKRTGSDISEISHSRNNSQCSESSCMVEMKIGSKNTTPVKLRSEKDLVLMDSIPAHQVSSHIHLLA